VANSNDHEPEKMHRRRERRKGSALIICTVVVLMLLSAVMATTQLAVGRAQTTSARLDSALALWAAEAGVAMKMHELRQSQGTGTGAVNYTFPDGRTVSVTCASANGFVRINSVGTVRPNGVNVASKINARVQHEVEVHVCPIFHPVFYKATYVGNSMGIAGFKLNFGPNQNYTGGGASWVESTWRDRNTKMSEQVYGIDFNNDGDLYDENITLGNIYDNRVAWGWNGFVTASGNNRRLDINKSGGALETTAVTTPTFNQAPQLRNPAADSPTPTTDPNYDTTAQKMDADYIEGDVYVNGDIDIKGKTNIFGTVDATGTSNGDPVGSTSNDNVAPITPPDLTAMNYTSIADRIVQGNTVPNYMRTQQDPSYYGDDLGPTSAHTNPYYHLNKNLDTTDFTTDASGNKLLVVKGNLWLHDTSSVLVDMPANKTRKLTIVVEGNLYVADDLNYNQGSNPSSGILFIVKGSETGNKENYVDENRNYRYDPGEKIMNDQPVGSPGHGVYEGPKEGQGNVFFGDPRFGTGGVTDGYIYAENNVYLVNPPNSAGNVNGQDAVFGVYGFLSAGGIMDLGNRTAGDNYNNFRVKYDPRLANGTLSFKGMPRGLGGGWNQAPVMAWRQVR
jgi:hypothetical protein